MTMSEGRLIYYSWNWRNLPARHSTGGDLYPILLLLRPHIQRYQWRVESEVDAIGPGLILLDAMTGKSSCGMEELITIISDIQQIIDGEIIGTMPATSESIKIEVVDNQQLVIAGGSAALIDYCVSLFGPPESVCEYP